LSTTTYTTIHHHAELCTKTLLALSCHESALSTVISTVISTVMRRAVMTLLGHWGPPPLFPVVPVVPVGASCSQSLLPIPPPLLPTHLLPPPL
jgi:hypothetical protein